VCMCMCMCMCMCQCPVWDGEYVGKLVDRRRCDLFVSSERTSEKEWDGG
jgi:hypothetical protein